MNLSKKIAALRAFVKTFTARVKVYIRRSNIKNSIRNSLLSIGYLVCIITILNMSYTFFNPRKIKKELVYRFLVEKMGRPEVAAALTDCSDVYLFDLPFLVSFIQSQSDFESKKISFHTDRTLLYGLCQINSKHARHYFKGKTTLELFEPKTNIAIAMFFLENYYYQANGNVIKALTLYREGESAVKKKKLGKDTLEYVTTILNEEKNIKKEIDNFIKKYKYLL